MKRKSCLFWSSQSRLSLICASSTDSKELRTIVRAARPGSGDLRVSPAPQKSALSSSGITSQIQDGSSCSNTVVAAPSDEEEAKPRLVVGSNDITQEIVFNKRTSLELEPESSEVHAFRKFL